MLNMSCNAYPMCGGGAETILCTSSGTHCASYQSFNIPTVAWACSRTIHCRKAEVAT